MTAPELSAEHAPPGLPVGAGPRKRVLLVTYPFPPVGGAGVQRVTKFVKYLPRHGWDVSVLTVSNPSVPLYDGSLQGDIPPGTIVRRARSWEPGYGLKSSVAAENKVGTGARWGVKRMAAGLLRRAGTFLLQPDPQVLWLPGATAEGRRLLRQVQHDVVLVSGPPFSTFLIGANLARGARLPLVLDYRDEWTISNAYWENKQLDPVSRYVQDRMQRRVVRAAAGLLATTRCSAEALQVHCRRAGGRAEVGWIYNGFDPDDFQPTGPADRAEDGRFRLSYVGTLWNLTSVAPVVEAMQRLSAAHPDLAARIELVFAGRRTGAQIDHVAALQGLPCRVVEHPYLDHSAAVRLMQGSQALCLLLSDLPGAGRVVPAKIFEYMAAARPILAVVPRGETWGLLEGHPGTGRFVPADVDGIAAWLAQAVRDHRTGLLANPAGWDASAYTRERETRQLTTLLDSVTSAHPRCSRDQ